MTEVSGDEDRVGPVEHRHIAAGDIHCLDDRRTGVFPDDRM